MTMENLTSTHLVLHHGTDDNGSVASLWGESRFVAANPVATWADTTEATPFTLHHTEKYATERAVGDERDRCRW